VCGKRREYRSIMQTYLTLGIIVLAAFAVINNVESRQQRQLYYSPNARSLGWITKGIGNKLGWLSPIKAVTVTFPQKGWGHGHSSHHGGGWGHGGKKGISFGAHAGLSLSSKGIGGHLGSYKGQAHGNHHGGHHGHHQSGWGWQPQQHHGWGWKPQQHHGWGWPKKHHGWGWDGDDDSYEDDYGYDERSLNSMEDSMEDSGESYEDSSAEPQVYRSFSPYVYDPYI